MLNKETRNKAEVMQSIVVHAKDRGVYPQLTAYDLEWLVDTLIEVDDKAQVTNCPSCGYELFE